MAAPSQPIVQQDKFLLSPEANPKQRKRFKRAVARQNASGISLNTTYLAFFVVMVGVYSANATTLRQHPKLNWIVTAALFVAIFAVLGVWILRLFELPRLVESGVAIQVPRDVWREYSSQCHAVSMRPWETFDATDLPALELAISAHKDIKPTTPKSVKAYFQSVVKRTIGQIVREQQKRHKAAVSQIAGGLTDQTQASGLSADELAQLQAAMDKFPIHTSLDKLDS